MHPVTSAIRLRDIPPKTSFIAFGVVLIFCSNTIEPASSSTQYQLDSITQIEPESSPRGDSGVFPARLPSAEKLDGALYVGRDDIGPIGPVKRERAHYQNCTSEPKSVHIGDGAADA